MKTATYTLANPAQLSHPIFSNFLTLAHATTNTYATKANQTVHTAFSLSALNPTDKPTMPLPAHSTYATMNRKPQISRVMGPPTTYAMSAIEWQCAWRLRKFPCTMAKYVFRAPQAITLREPPIAPRANMAVGMERTPVAKITEEGVSWDVCLLWLHGLSWLAWSEIFIDHCSIFNPQARPAGPSLPQLTLSVL
jgi:hypothetical protein